MKPLTSALFMAALLLPGVAAAQIKTLPGESMTVTATIEAVDTASESVVPGSGKRPSGTATAQRTITATITAIDPNVPSISLSGPNNWTFSSRVEDRTALKQVKVGDRLDVTWTEAVLVSFDTLKSK